VGSSGTWEALRGCEGYLRGRLWEVDKLLRVLGNAVTANSPTSLYKLKRVYLSFSESRYRLTTQYPYKLYAVYLA